MGFAIRAEKQLNGRKIKWKGGEAEMNQKVEFIESYIKIGNSDYKWNDNHGELIRCEDCRYGYRCKNAAGEDAVECSNHYVSLEQICRKPDWFCADGERKTE